MKGGDRSCDATGIGEPSSPAGGRVTSLEQVAAGMNLTVEEVKDALQQLEDAFEQRPINGELGRSRDDMQWLPETTTRNRRPVPRVYRGFERMASADTRPVLRTRPRTFTRIGPEPRSADTIEIAVRLRLPGSA